MIVGVISILNLHTKVFKVFVLLCVLVSCIHLFDFVVSSGSNQVSGDSESFSSLSVSSKLPELGIIEPAWREIGPWEKLRWIVVLSPKRGQLITEDSLVKLLEELATVGNEHERRTFLRMELREGLVKEFCGGNSNIRRMLAELYVLGAVEALKRGYYVSAESFVMGSQLTEPGLASQSLVQEEIRSLYWDRDSWDRFKIGQSVYILIGCAFLGFVAFLLAHGSSVQIHEITNSREDRDICPFDYSVDCERAEDAGTDEQGLTDITPESFVGQVSVDESDASIEDVFIDPDSFVGDMVQFDFAVGARRKDD